MDLSDADIRGKAMEGQEEGKVGGHERVGRGREGGREGAMAEVRGRDIQQGGKGRREGGRESTHLAAPTGMWSNSLKTSKIRRPKDRSMVSDSWVY